MGVGTVCRFFKLSLLLLLTVVSSPAYAMEGGCGEGKCSDCHSFDKQEAEILLGDKVDRVITVFDAEVPGLWVVEVEKGGQRSPLYVDYSKSFIIAGNVYRLKNGENLTRKRVEEWNRVDFAAIPLEDALLLGNKEATNKVIVFTDPECPYCKKLHKELQDVVRTDPDIAFLIKLFPLKMHPNAYTISKSIVCRKSLALLEDSFEGKTVPPPLCETSLVDQTIEVVKELGIRSTPTIVLPDGRVMPGFKKAEDLLRILGSSRVALLNKNNNK